MLMIELVSKWEICWLRGAKLCLIRLMTRLNSNNVAWFLIGDFLRLSPWSEDLGQQAQAEALMDKPPGGSGATGGGGILACFVAHCESYA